MRAKLIFLTLVTMFVAASVVAPKHPETTPSNTAISVTKLPPALGTRMPVRDLWMATMLNEDSDTYRRESYKSAISDAEAVDIAIQKGEALAATRGTSTSYQPSISVEVTPAAAETTVPEATATETTTTANTESAAAPEALAWTIKGDRVNLRAGPGTEHGIVGVANSGEAVKPLSGMGTDWVEIRRADGSLAWIFAKFVGPSNT